MKKLYLPLLLLILSVRSHAYIQLEVNPGHWGMLVEEEGSLSYLDCGSRQLAVEEMEALSPTEVVFGCLLNSRYRINSADYRLWTAAHYKVPTLIDRGKWSLLGPELQRRIDLSRAKKEANPTLDSQKLKTLLHLENVLFRYLGSLESITLTQEKAFPEVYAAVSGLVPTFSDGKVALKLARLNSTFKSNGEWKGCPKNWAPASLYSLLKILTRDEVESFLQWLEIAAKQQNVKVPTSLFTWQKWIQPKKITYATTSCIRKDFLFELKLDQLRNNPHSASVLTLATNPSTLSGFGSLFELTSPSSTQSFLGLCLRREFPVSHSTEDTDKVLSQIASSFRISPKILHQLLLTDEGMERHLGETNEVRSWLSANLHPDLADYEQLALPLAKMDGEAQRNIEATRLHQGGSRHWLRVCNRTRGTLYASFGFELDQPYGWTTYSWIAIGKNECPVLNMGEDEFFYTYFQSENNASLNISGSPALTEGDRPDRFANSAQITNLVAGGKTKAISQAIFRSPDSDSGTIQTPFRLRSWQNERGTQADPGVLEVSGAN